MAINIDELYLYSDNAAGQNKNHSIICFLMSLVDAGQVSKVMYRLPMHGYSVLPKYRYFDVLKHRLNKVDWRTSKTGKREIFAISSYHEHLDKRKKGLHTGIII